MFNFIDFSQWVYDVIGVVAGVSMGIGLCTFFPCITLLLIRLIDKKYGKEKNY